MTNHTILMNAKNILKETSQKPDWTLLHDQNKNNNNDNLFRKDYTQPRNGGRKLANDEWPTNNTNRQWKKSS